MTRKVFHISCLAITACVYCASAQAQVYSVPGRTATMRPVHAKPIRTVRQSMPRSAKPQGVAVTRISDQTDAKPDTTADSQSAKTYQGYTQLGAGMYPSPVQNVPPQIGGTLITNPALAPHEMLYPHEYKAMYPPFYFKVRGSWLWTPWGIRSHDVWELRGTEVSVKYKKRYPWLQPFAPPVGH